MSDVTLLCIATGKYSQWVPQLLRSVRDYFLVEHAVSVLLFTDVEGGSNEKSDRVNVRRVPVQSLGFPEATLFRHHVFLSRESLITGDYVFYIDVDCRVASPVGNEILNEFTVVQHASFVTKGTGSWENRPESTAYVSLEETDRYFYVVGGFNGGTRESYLKWMRYCQHHVDVDLDNGVIARWHDESHLNKFIHTGGANDVTMLPPTYCYPEHTVGHDLKILCLVKGAEFDLNKNLQPDPTTLAFDRGRL